MKVLRDQMSFTRMIGSSDPWKFIPVRLRLCAESVSHSAAFFFHNKTVNNIFSHDVNMRLKATTYDLC